jgi:hypothetical protein
MRSGDSGPLHSRTIHDTPSSAARDAGASARVVWIDHAGDADGDASSLGPADGEALAGGVGLAGRPGVGVGASDGGFDGVADGGGIVGAGAAGPEDTTTVTDVPTATR